MLVYFIDTPYCTRVTCHKKLTVSSAGDGNCQLLRNLCMERASIICISLHFIVNKICIYILLLY